MAHFYTRKSCTVLAKSVFIVLGCIRTRLNSIVSTAAILFPGFGVIAQIDTCTVNTYCNKINTIK